MAKTNSTSYTSDISKLAQYAPLGPAALNGTCTAVPEVKLSQGGASYIAHVRGSTGGRVASVTDERLLLVK